MSSNKKQPAISIKNLSKRYQVYGKPQDRLWQALWRGQKTFYQEFEALKPLSLDIAKGQAVGIVGRNGSGKSTLLQMICGTLTPSTGEATVNGRVSALLELGAGFNPDFTGRENVHLNAAILGLSKEEIEEKFDAIHKFSGIGDKIDRPVSTYSSGMFVRLAFAVAVAIDPDILIVDEALAVGDVKFQRKCYGRIKEMQAKGTTILFVSHSENIVIETCDSAILLDEGELLTQDTPKLVFEQYNRLVFAPDDNRIIIREKIKQGRYKKEIGSKKKQIMPIYKGNEAFDPHMQTHTKAIHESQGVEIIDPSLMTPKGKKVNVLKSGETYTLLYQVHFQQNYEHVRCNFRLRTTTGVLLAGANSQTYDAKLKKVSAGDIYNVEFEFNNRFIEGDYFVQIGLTAVKDNIRVPIHRVNDALMFRVASERGIQNAGFVDLGTKVSMDKIKQQ